MFPHPVWKSVASTIEVGIGVRVSGGDIDAAGLIDLIAPGDSAGGRPPRPGSGIVVVVAPAMVVVSSGWWWWSSDHRGRAGGAPGTVVVVQGWW
jgi:hypothetical protein